MSHRSERRRVAGLLLAICLGLALAGAPQSHAEADGETPVRIMSWADLTGRVRPPAPETIRWGAGEGDVVDLWLPDTEGPHPVVIMVHGGCWQKSIADRTLMDWMADGLARQGWAVWNIEYRGVDEPGGGYPGTFLDVSLAADAVQDHASRFNLDLDRVTGIGHSAGGHLVLWLAARSRLPPDSVLRPERPVSLRGVVISGGLADLEVARPLAPPGCLDAVWERISGEGSEANTDLLAQTSPARLLPAGVSFVSVHGDSDRIAPPILGEMLAEKAVAAGDAAGFVLVPGTGHVELVTPGTEAFDVQARLLREFLAAR